jgi:lysyl-tRNA synthetase class 2
MRNWKTLTSHKILLERALLLKNIRAFFDVRDVLEVETPLLSSSATTDPHLDSLQSRFREQSCYLNTSPEYAMKRLLASVKKPIYQVCKAFRDDELGANHNPEFTLLEWYQPGYDDVVLMDELELLIKTVCHASVMADLSTVETSLSFQRLSYQQIFEQVAQINPHKTTAAECHQVAIKNNIPIPQGLMVDDGELNDWLDWLLTQMILPRFKKDSFTFLYDYPAAQCALAKIALNQQQTPVAKRFELFFGEMELANGFYELTDADEQLLRFQSENQRRVDAGKTKTEIDEKLIAALRYGLPDCAGVALGLDRLLMVLSKSDHIEKVLSFSWVNS